jgi:hypothetical protein
MQGWMMAEYLARAVKRRPHISKLDCLLFETMAVMDAEAQLAELYERDPAAAADYEYLASEGFVEPAVATGYEVGEVILTALGNKDVEEYLTAAEREVLWRMASAARHPSKAGLADRLLPEGGELIVASAERLYGLPSVAILEQRMSDVQWSELEDVFLTTAVRRFRGGLAPGDISVMDLVINRLPTIGDDIPLEDVLAFSRDPETRDRATALRLWMAKSYMRNVPLQELAVELDEWLHEFRRHMEVQRLKTVDRRLRMLIKVPVAIVGDLLQGKPRLPLNQSRGRQAALIDLRLNSLHLDMKLPSSRQRDSVTADTGTDTPAAPRSRQATGPAASSSGLPMRTMLVSS